jgi:O-antigen ligase
MQGQERAADAAIPTATVVPERRRGEGIAIALQWFLIAILATAPLPLASSRPLASSLLALASAFLLCLAITCELIDGTPAQVFAPLRLPAVLLVLLGLWIGFQSVHLNSEVLSGIWSSASRALQGAIIPSISLDRAASLERSLRLLAYAAVFLAAWRVSRRAEQAETVLRAIASIGCAYSLYGLIVYFSGNQTILWYPKWAFKLDLTSTFVNRDHFATFAGLGLIATLALTAQKQIRHIDARSSRTFIQTSVESVLWRGRWLTAGLLVIGSAILFTHSRGGTTAALIGICALIASAMSAPSLRAPWRYSFAAIGILGAITVFAVNGSGVLQRVATTSVAGELRFDIDRGTWLAIGEHALMGTGLGTFQFVYAPFQPQSVGLLIDRAHNDYLENVLELGIPAAAIFYAILLLLTASCVRGVLRRRRNAIFPCAAFSATALIGSHAVVDFSMQMPATAITYAAMLGVGVAQSIGSKQRDASSG